MDNNHRSFYPVPNLKKKKKNLQPEFQAVAQNGKDLFLSKKELKTEKKEKKIRTNV